MQIVIIGTGGMAKEIWGLCRRMEYEVIGFITQKSDGKTEMMGCPIICDDEAFLRQSRADCVIANGTPRVRKKIVETYYNSSHTFPNIIHPKAHILGVLDLSKGKRGITIMPGGVIQPDVEIGNFVHINMGVTIGHDVSIGVHSVINHNAGISGNVRIGRGVLIGAGSVIIEGNTIGDGATIGAGAVVTKNVPPGETWVGVPAKPLDGRFERQPTYAELYGVQ